MKGEKEGPSDRDKEGEKVVKEEEASTAPLPEKVCCEHGFYG